MGRRKGSKNKSKREYEYESKNITSLILAFIGIFLGVIIYITAEGNVSGYISNIFGGILGKVKYLIPVVFFVTGIYGIINGKEYIKKKMAQMVIFLIILSAFCSWLNYPYNDAIPVKDNISSYYQNGVVLKDGGLIGSLIVTPIYQSFGKIPTLIVLIALLSIFFVLITEMNVQSVLYFIKDAVLDFVYFLRNVFSKSDDKEKKTSRRKREIDENQVEIELEENDEEDEEEEEEEEETEEEIQKKEAVKKKLQDSGLFNIKTKEEIEFEKEKNKVIEELKLDHNEIEDDEDTYVFPTTDLLNNVKNKVKSDNAAIKETAEKLQQTLNSFGVRAKVINVSKGPVVTRYELQPNIGVKVSQIVNLADDIALNLAATNLRIEAPIPGKAAVGIELPNTNKEMVGLRELIETPDFANAKSKLSYALGKDIGGDTVISDIAEMPHVLISGATGSGKSVCINTMITSILFKAKPSEVKLLMIDPKVVELGMYNGIPHLLIPVVTDPKKAAGALNWAVQEMVLRYSLFASKGVKDIKGYNEILEKENKAGVLPKIVIIIDELADLMMVAKNEVEDAICRLAQMARAAGMHLVVATQRPSVDVITGIIKANIPSRIAFSTTSQIDSRTIIDMAGAEKLLGKGDMLYFPTGYSKPVRLQGAYVSEKEIDKVVEFIKSNCTSNYDEDIIDKIENQDNLKTGVEEDDDVDSLLIEAIDLVVNAGQASTSMLQRRLKVGYARAGRIIDQMEARGIISGYEGSKPRQVLVSKEELQELRMGTSDSVKNDTTTNVDDENFTANAVDGDYE